MPATTLSVGWALAIAAIGLLPASSWLAAMVTPLRALAMMMF